MLKLRPNTEGYHAALVFIKIYSHHLILTKVMKKFNFSAIAATLFFCFLTNINLSAQAEQNFFMGKWDMFVKGLPQGDTHMHVVFKMAKDADGKESMVGHIEKTAETEEIVFTKIEPEAEKITFYFTAQGYDINVELVKKDDTIAEGKLFNMFENRLDLFGCFPFL